MDATTHQPSRWDPLFAAGYDTMLRLGERLGMRAQRRLLLARARGRTLEIGGGTGLNIPLYPGGLEDLILAEPYEPMRRRLERRLASDGRSARTIDASAESIPLPDGSLDTVVSTLVLCTVDDPGRALAEIARVLSPGGQLLFIEHVRSHSPRVARWQDRFEAPWRHLAGWLPVQSGHARPARPQRLPPRVRGDPLARPAADRGAGDHRQGLAGILMIHRLLFPRGNR